MNSSAMRVQNKTLRTFFVQRMAFEKAAAPQLSPDTKSAAGQDESDAVTESSWNRENRKSVSQVQVTLLGALLLPKN